MKYNLKILNHYVVHQKLIWYCKSTILKKRYIAWHNSGQCIFGFYTKSTGSKSKDQQVEILQTKKLLQNKRNNQQNEKATYEMGEKFCKPMLDKGSISEIYKNSYNSVKKKKANNLVFKMGRGSKQTFFQIRQPNGRQVHEKKLNITNHQENANWNANEISLYTC